MPRRLNIGGGFAVIDQQQRRLHDRAIAHGFGDLDTYLLERAHQRASLSQLASELATTIKVIRRLLDQAGITPSPRKMTAARRRRTGIDQHMDAQAAKLGFASLQDYLVDRATTRRWPSTMIAEELGVHPPTVRDRLDQHGLLRQRATIRPYRTIQAQTACWAAKRQARLGELGFADVEAYLRVRRVGQGWSLRRMLAELRVGSAWLKAPAAAAGHPVSPPGQSLPCRAGAAP